MQKESRSKWRLVVAVTGVVALFAAPVAVSAAHQFTDVPDTNVFHDDIAWLADAEITKGCNPPANTAFCPGDGVTRQQMAAFMRRLAQYLGAEDGVVSEADHATTAGDADTVGGMDASAFLGSTDTATDSDKLDGKDSTAFVQKNEVDSVSSSMMTDSAGFAQTVSKSEIHISTPATLTSVELEVPASGYVLVQATFESWMSHSTGTNDYCGYDVSAVDATMPADLQPNTHVPADAASGIYAVMSSASRAYPVAGAGTYTFYLVGTSNSGSCAVNDMVLTALYFPISYDTP